MHAPKIPSAISAPATRVFESSGRSDSAISASTPPSPLLSARITNSRYLMPTTRMMAQNSSEITPRIDASVSGMPCAGLNASLSEYSGLVPMSPNTTPMAAIASARIECCCVECGACAASVAWIVSFI